MFNDLPYLHPSANLWVIGYHWTLVFVHASLCITSETLQKTSFRNGWGGWNKMWKFGNTGPLLIHWKQRSWWRGMGRERPTLCGYFTKHLYENYFCETLWVLFRSECTAPENTHSLTHSLTHTHNTEVQMQWTLVPHHCAALPLTTMSKPLQRSSEEIPWRKKERKKEIYAGVLRHRCGSFHLPKIIENTCTLF